MIQLYGTLAAVLFALPFVASQACVDIHADCPTRNCRNRLVRRECPFSCRRCVGSALAQWTNWNQWSTCDVACGVGNRRRQRVCNIRLPPPPPPPPTCPGDSEELQTCSLPSCITGVFSNWSDWVCNVECGTGTETRTRACQGVGCVGDTEETRPCMKPACTSGVWNNWSDWVCNVQCGTGLQTRTRTCQTTGCVGDARETMPCVLPPCPLDWSACSKTCGSGTRRRYFCNSVSCVWQYEACNTQLCPLDSTCSNSFFNRFRYGSTRQCCFDNQVPFGTFCGSTTLTNRIIGGTPAVSEQWPWLVAFEYRFGLVKGFCGGAIISPTFILSAAHCFKDESTLADFTVTQIYPGVLTLQDIGMITTLPVGIKRIIVHPDFRLKNADIALVEIDRSLKYTATVRPICLPYREATPVDQYCFVAGWGVSTLPSLNTNRLQEAKVYNFEPRVCTERYKSLGSVATHVSFLESYNGFLCAGRLDQRIDACSGDSGGPLVCQRCTSCTWYVAGIVSFGPNPCAAPQAPGIYTKVTHFEDWIFTTTGIPRNTATC